jgi:hypothetical protein
MDQAAIRTGILREIWQGRAPRMEELLRWDCHPTIILCGVGMWVKLLPLLFGLPRFMKFSTGALVENTSRNENFDLTPAHG